MKPIDVGAARTVGPGIASFRNMVGTGVCPMQRLSAPTILLFVALSVCDLIMTWWLLERSGRCITEANPIAEWWLSRFGWIGLAGFKAAIISIVVLLAGAIARQRPRAAANVLVFACAVLTVVVIHSAVLAQSAPTPGERSAEINRELEEINVRTRRLTAGVQDYTDFVKRLVGRVSTGELTLAEAIERLMKWEKNRDPAWQRVLMSVYPGRTMQQALARQMLDFVRDAGAAPATRYRLQREFETLFSGEMVEPEVGGERDVI
jgi:hypothetical protein